MKKIFLLKYGNYIIQIIIIPICISIVSSIIWQYRTNRILEERQVPFIQSLVIETGHFIADYELLRNYMKEADTEHKFIDGNKQISPCAWINKKIDVLVATGKEIITNHYAYMSQDLFVPMHNMLYQFYWLDMLRWQ